MFEKYSRSATIAIISIALTTLSAPASLFAAETDDSASSRVIEEVMVSARRKSESLQDVPGSITVLTSAAIESAGIQRAEDFIGLTPGVSLVNSAEAGDTQVNIRGINGARDAENSFAFVLDGILYSNPASFNREYTNLKQIEVFKGPQGAIYGRNAAAGAMIVTTEKPSFDEYSGNFNASLAEDSTTTAKGSISGPLTSNMAYTLAADYRTTDGFRRNAFKNNSATIDAFESSNINARLIYEPTDNLSMDFKTRFGKIDANSIGFNATFHLPVFANALGIPEGNEDVNDHDFVFQPNVDSDNDQDAFELSGKFDYEMANSTLSGWALYTDIENNLIADGTSGAFGFYNNDPACQQSVTDLNTAGVTLPSPQFFGASPVGIIFTPTGSFLGPYTPSTCDGIQEQLRNQKDFSAELRLASSGDSALDWMVGAFVMDIEREVGVSLNRDGGATPIRGLLQTSGPNRTDQLIYDQFDSSIYAIFGQLGYDITDSVEASLALRYDVEDREVQSLVPTDLTQSIIDLNFDGIFNDPLNPGLSPLVNPAGTIPNKSEKYTQLQPKFSLTWDALNDITLFANYGVGFKAGGFNNSGSAATVSIFNNGLISTVSGVDFSQQIGSDLPVITDDYGKETSDAVEIGFKSSAFDGRLKMNAALYQTNVDDMQFFEFFVGGFGLLRVVSNIDEVDISGIEFGAEAVLSDYMNAYFGYNLIDSEIKANSSRPDTVGNKSPYTPDYTINLGSDFNFPLSNGMQIALRADGQWVGPTWFHTVQGGDRATIFNPLFEIGNPAVGFGPGSGGLGVGNFANARRAEYFTLNLRAGLVSDNWSVTAFVDNATDEDYVEEVIPAPEFGGSFNFPGSKRRAGLEFSYKF